MNGSRKWIYLQWTTDAKYWLIRKDPGAGQDWRQEEKGVTEDERVGWHNSMMSMSLSKLWELVMDGKPGALHSLGLQRVRHDYEWLNWTDYSALKKKEHLPFAIMWMNYFSSSTFLEFTYIWYYAVFVFLCLDYLTKHNRQRNLAGCKELDTTEWLTTQRNREQDGGLQGLGGGVGKWGDVGLRA